MNNNNLAEGVNVLWVEDEQELLSNKVWFINKHTIGIAAGASTPGWLIDIAEKVVKGV